MAVTTNTRKLAALLGASGEGIGTDGKLGESFHNMASQAELDVSRTNIALVAFKAATAGSLAKYNLQDQIVDEFVDATGIDATPSTNHTLASGAYSSKSGSNPTGGASVDTSVAGYRTHVFSSSASLTVGTAGNVSVLVVAGGGSGGAFSYGGGGGAGGLVYDAVYAVTANTYDAVIGAGGLASGSGSGGDGNIGGDSTWTINGGAMQFTAKGGGGGNCQTIRADDGGSGGGSGYAATTGEYGTTTQAGTTQGVTPDVSIGYNGGELVGAPNYNPGGGGGAGGAGGTGTTVGGIGGVGYNASAVFGTAVGESGWFASGGGGGYSANGAGGSGSASIGGGGAGGGSTGNGEAGQANTGGGSGGGGDAGSLVAGSGVILVRYATAEFETYAASMTIQSTDTTAETEADYADMVMLMEDTAGTATVNTDIKGYISEDSGVTFTQGTLVDEGDWGTNKRILAFHDLDISAQSGTAMCYKITTHNQSASKETKIHATSIGWK